MKHIEVNDLTDETRELVRACEVTGRRTAFVRNGRMVGVLVSWDEYLALRETIDVARDETLRERIAAASGEIRRNRMLLVEDLTENSTDNDQR